MQPRYKQQDYSSYYFTHPLPGMGIDIYAPSLPAIQSHFGASLTQTQLTITLYLLGLGLGQLFLGILSDYIGQKKVLISSLFFLLLSVFSVNFQAPY